MMVPEHLPSMPYTHVTSGRVWNLESVSLIFQYSAFGGWPGMSFCSLLCVVSCTGRGLMPANLSRAAASTSKYAHMLLTWRTVVSIH